jgi:hypothetical protein
MGTFDTIGGTPRHDSALDAGWDEADYEPHQVPCLAACTDAQVTAMAKAGRLGAADELIRRGLAGDPALVKLAQRHSERALRLAMWLRQ